MKTRQETLLRHELSLTQLLLATSSLVALVFGLVFLMSGTLTPEKVLAVTYDNNYQDINFGGSGVTISYYPTGSNGENQGDVVLYENVTTIGGTSIDCYIVTDSLSSGCSINDYDMTASSGTGYSGNEERYFSPNMRFPNGSSSGPGGQISYTFQFIADGSFSYNTGSGLPSGTNITLTNVKINAYDIDGNGFSYSNQAAIFGGFQISELASNTRIVATYDASSTLTSFRSNTGGNVSDIKDDRTRVRVFYDSISNFKINATAGGSTVYFFIDFGAGDSWDIEPDHFTQVHGALIDDGDANVDNEIDGPGIGTLSATNMYVSLVRADTVRYTAQVKATGLFSFPTVLLGNYDLVLHSTFGGSKTVSVPSGWVSTAENLGTGTGHDGTIDGILALTVDSAGLTDCRLAVNKLPETDDYNLTITSPKYNDMITLGTAGTSALSGTDLEDGSKGDGDVIYIYSLPSNGNELWYNGTQITSASSGSPHVLSSYDPSLLEVRFIGIGAVDTEFDYAVEDSSGAIDPSPATYSLGWSVALPVNLLSFDVTEDDGLVELKWSTSMEYGTKEFVIERQWAGDQFSSEIGAVQAFGNSNSIIQYSFEDYLSPENKGTVSYRLRVVDFDGETDFSEWETIIVQTKNELLIYPNPAIGGSITISTGNVEEQAQVQILDLNGKVYSETVITNGQVEINIQDMTKGFYIVRVYNRSAIQTQRLQIL